MGTGRPRRTTSVTIPKIAVVTYSAGRLIHEPDVIVTSQLFSIGLQAKIKLKKMPIV